MADNLPPVTCRDECGASVPAREVQSRGWEYPPIQNRYRCVDCWRRLNEANAPKGESR